MQEIREDYQGLLRGLMQEALHRYWKRGRRKLYRLAKGERSSNRLRYPSGYYGRSLVTRVGKLELRVPQDRGEFPTRQRQHARISAVRTAHTTEGFIDDSSLSILGDNSSC